LGIIKLRIGKKNILQGSNTSDKFTLANMDDGFELGISGLAKQWDSIEGKGDMSHDSIYTMKKRLRGNNMDRSIERWLLLP